MDFTIHIPSWLLYVGGGIVCAAVGVGVAVLLARGAIADAIGRSLW